MFQVDFIAHDAATYVIKGVTDDCYAKFKEADMFLETQRTESVSTTDLIDRIVRNHEKYAQRNLAKLAANSPPTLNSDKTD